LHLCDKNQALECAWQKHKNVKASTDALKLIKWNNSLHAVRCKPDFEYCQRQVNDHQQYLERICRLTVVYLSLELRELFQLAALNELGQLELLITEPDRRQQETDVAELLEVFRVFGSVCD
jgi:hypothetical protein